MFYVYILKSEIDGNFYIGYSRDLKKDLKSITREKFLQPGQEDRWFLFFMKHSSAP